MAKKQLPASPPHTVRPIYPHTVRPIYLPILYVHDENTKGKFNWDVDEPLVKVVRKYLRYIAHKTFR